MQRARREVSRQEELRGSGGGGGGVQGPCHFRGRPDQTGSSGPCTGKPGDPRTQTGSEDQKSRRLICRMAAQHVTSDHEASPQNMEASAQRETHLCTWQT